MAFIDDIKKNDKLKELPEDVLNELDTVYRNNEQVAINEITSRNAKQIEEDVFKLSGNEKPQGMKYYEYVKTEFNRLKENVVPKTEYEGLKVEFEKAQKMIETGLSDETAKQQLSDYKTRIAQLETDLQQKDKTYAETLAQRDAAELQKASSSSMLKYIAKKSPANGMNKDLMQDVAETKVKSLLLDYNPERVRGGDGTETINFRDRNGTILLNPDDSHRPHTPESLAKKHLAAYVQDDRVVTGAETTNGKPNVKASIIIANAKTRVEADELIKQKLNQL